LCENTILRDLGAMHCYLLAHLSTRRTIKIDRGKDSE
jgi:hypothetical protein